MENLENNNQTNQAPSPDTSTQAAPVEKSGTEVANPAPSKAEDKSASAFIRMRQERSALKQERRALKQRIAELEATKNAEPQPKVEAVVAPKEEPKPIEPTPAPQANIVQQPSQPEANKQVVADEGSGEDVAIKALAADPDVASIPGGIIEVIDMLDSNPKLAKLNAIDSKIAYAEAVKLWKDQHGITQTPPIPAPAKVSGGISGSKADLDVLYAKLDKAKPGTKEYNELVAQMNSSLGVGQKPIRWNI